MTGTTQQNHSAELSREEAMLYRVGQWRDGEENEPSKHRSLLAELELEVIRGPEEVLLLLPVAVVLVLEEGWE